jgi:hypothetical protein
MLYNPHPPDSCDPCTPWYKNPKKVTGYALLMHYFFGDGEELAYGAEAWDDLVLGSEDVSLQMRTPLFMMAYGVSSDILAGSEKGTVWDYFGVTFDPTKSPREWLLHDGTMVAAGSWKVDNVTDEEVKFTMDLKFTYLDQGDLNFNYTFDQISGAAEVLINTGTVYAALGYQTNPYLISVVSGTKTIQVTLNKTSGAIRLDWPPKRDPPPSDTPKRVRPKQ